MLAFSIDYYGMIFRATQSVELFCAYDKETLGGNANEKFVYLLQNIPYKKERAGLSTGVMKKET